MDSGHKVVGRPYDMTRTAVVLGHLDKTGTRQLSQKLHIVRIGPSELVDVLVVVAHSYYAHLLVIVHQGLDQRIVVSAHVLCLIYYQYRLTYLGGFYLAVAYHLGSIGHHIIRLLQRANAA